MNATVQPELHAPCPFCGGRAKLTTKRRGNYRREGDNLQGLCGRCKARGPLRQDSPENAALAWETRVYLPPDNRDAVRLDFMMDMRCIITSSRDGESIGVSQVDFDEGDMVLHAHIPLGGMERREAIDAAITRWNERFGHIKRYE